MLGSNAVTMAEIEADLRKLELSASKVDRVPYRFTPLLISILLVVSGFFLLLQAALDPRHSLVDGVQLETVGGFDRASDDRDTEPYTAALELAESNARSFVRLPPGTGPARWWKPA